MDDFASRYRSARPRGKQSQLSFGVHHIFSLPGDDLVVWRTGSVLFIGPVESVKGNTHKASARQAIFLCLHRMDSRLAIQNASESSDL